MALKKPSHIFDGVDDVLAFPGHIKWRLDRIKRVFKGLPELEDNLLKEFNGTNQSGGLESKLEDIEVRRYFVVSVTVALFDKDDRTYSFRILGQSLENDFPLVYKIWNKHWLKIRNDHEKLIKKMTNTRNKVMAHHDKDQWDYGLSVQELVNMHLAQLLEDLEQAEIEVREALEEEKRKIANSIPAGKL